MMTNAISHEFVMIVKLLERNGIQWISVDIIICLIKTEMKFIYLIIKKKMQHIKTQREIFRHLLRRYEVDDVYDFFQLAQGGRENFLHDIEMEFLDKQNEELTKYMNAKLENSKTKEVLEQEFIFWVEKNRGRPLDMGEMCDIGNAIEDWAEDNGYGYLYED